MTTISRTELARNTREIVEQVRRGQPVIVHSYGEDQVVLLDMLDYRILQALVSYALGGSTPEPHTVEEAFHRAVGLYLDDEISLAKAAELLGLSRFELMARFERFGVPLRLGPRSVEEAKDEMRTARKGKTSRE